MSEFNPEYLPELEGPKDCPRPHEFETSEVVYVGGSANVPEPEWIKQEAERMQRERQETTDVTELPVSSRLRTQRSIINSEFFWYGSVIDGDYRDTQNGIRPPFKP